jgi:hypothetical protein
MAAMAESEPVLPLPLEDAMGSEDVLCFLFLARTNEDSEAPKTDRSVTS